jgi:class 3 adenylate cyclase/CRP-like cAMP-binding protein
MDNKITQQLKKAFLFRSLSEEMLETLSQVVNIRDLKKDELLFRAGDAGASLFVIGTGKIKIVTKNTVGMDVILNEAGIGEIIGEMSLFDEAPRSANAVAMEDTTVLEVKRADFLPLIDNNPVALSVIRGMSDRMRVNTSFIQKVTEWSQKIAADDFSFIDQTQARDSLGAGAIDGRTNKFLTAFIDMARDVKEREKKIPPHKRIQKIEPDLRNLLSPELYADLYVAEWADRSPSAPKLVHPKTKKEITPDLYDGLLLEPVFNHLVVLQKILSDYASSLITEKRDENTAQHVIWRNGALMFTDLAGFTKLMEANAGKGKEGAESLLGVLTKYFTDIIEVIGKSGGELLEFTGDALLVLFPAQFKKDNEAEYAKELEKAIVKAVRAGLRMQKIMEKGYQKIQTASGETITLQMRIGVHAGHFYSADIGTPRRREHVLLGENVQTAKKTESYGQNGRVNLTPKAYEYVKDAKEANEDFGFEPNPEHEGFMLVVDHLKEEEGYELGRPSTRRLASTMLLDKGFDNTYEQVKNLLTAIKELSAFIPNPVLSLLVESAARRKIPPEFPTPTVMFVNFIGLPEMIDKRNDKGERIYEEDSIVASFNEMFAKLNGAVEKRGGMLKKVTYHLTGSDIVIYFGVPLPHSNDPMRAVSAALEAREIIMNTKMPKLRPGCQPEPEGDKPKIFCQVGINTGPTFVAEFGDPRGRREFNVLGDTVNTTARLMSKAGVNQILISEAVMKQIDTDKYECVAQEPMKLKGKSQEVKVYELVGRKDKKG